MPFERHIIPAPGTVIGIWKIEEEAGELEGRVTLSPGEILMAGSIKNQRRKSQWLASRLILAEIFGKDYLLEYDEYGKPFLSGHPGVDISVSHSGEYAAVILSKTHWVGIDMEMIKEKIHRIRDRFLSEDEKEEALRQDDTERLYVYWGAKEALYKINGRPDIDFQKDLIVQPFDYLCAGQCTAVIRNGRRAGKYTVCYEKTGNYLLVYALRPRKDRLREMPFRNEET